MESLLETGLQFESVPDSQFEFEDNALNTSSVQLLLKMK